MNVLVTGAAGLTGGAVVRELLARGHAVTGAVRDAASTPRIAAPAIAVVADTDDPASMAPLMAAADAVCHVAGILASRGIAGDALGRARTVLVVSTASLYSSHHSATDRYREAEARLLAARPDIVLVRPTMIYGSRRDRNVHRAVDFARRFRFLPLPGDGHGLLQPIHYADLAAAIATLVERGATGIVDAGGAEPITMRDAASAILAALGQPQRLVPIPLAVARLGAVAFDALTRTRWAEKVDRALEDRVVDNARLVALTGIHPRAFAQGARDQVTAR